LDFFGFLRVLIFFNRAFFEKKKKATERKLQRIYLVACFAKRKVSRVFFGFGFAFACENLKKLENLETYHPKTPLYYPYVLIG
jgi:hypothetical protein